MKNKHLNLVNFQLSWKYPFQPRWPSLTDSSRFAGLFIGLYLGLSVPIGSVQFLAGPYSKAMASETEDLSTAFSELCWVAYSPSTFDPTQNPIVWPSVEEIREDFQVLRRAGFAGLVTYGAYFDNPEMPGQAINMATIAQEEGFEGMIIGVWDPTNETELRTAIAESQSPIVLGYSVGNEGLDVRYDFETLVAAMARLRTTTSRLVTTTEELGDYYANPQLVEVGDWIFPMCIPTLPNCDIIK
jgi:exo-beta-1,3-glucanase (GH17 family)